MHIPDGFLSPATCAVCYAAAAPVWVLAWKKLSSLRLVDVPAKVGFGAAFIFLLQMFNVPILGGTSGHAVGAAITAIALGPWISVIAVSLAVLLQALVFGDGGLLAYGANALNMGIIQSLAAYAVWRAVSGPAPSIRRTSIGVFIAAFASVLCGAAATALQLGLQPALHTDVTGQPLYFPLGLSITLPAMLGSHLIIGAVEATVSAVAITVLARSPSFRLYGSEDSNPSLRARYGPAALALVVMALLVPAGVLLPAWANSGEPWGEWSKEETAKLAGLEQVPAGMDKYMDKYPAPVPDYQFTEAGHRTSESLQYIGAALIGMLLVVAISVPLQRFQQARLRRMRGKA